MPGAGLPDDFFVINDNGAWCWFQDERALIHGDTLVVGSVAAAEGPGGALRSGDVEVTVVDLVTKARTAVVLHAGLEADDHNTPALLRRRDGRWLAIYTKHKRDDLTRWRISEVDDPTTWGPERIFDWSELTGGAGVTYSNVHRTAGRLYCVQRAINDDPSALVSDDEGTTWSYAGKLFTREKVGYVNGYVRYASGGGRIDVLTTDHHPRDYDNSIYHGYLSGGALHDSSGAVVDERALEGDAPNQDRLTTVLATGTVVGASPMTHLWTVDLRRSPGGVVAGVISGRSGPQDPAMRYDRDRPLDELRLAYARKEPGSPWRVYPLAEAGLGLLAHEQDYSGLAAVDPYDLDSVYVSTPIDPRTGEALAHHEIFAGRTDDGGASWTWTPVTYDSPVDNFRPIVVPGDERRRVLLWMRGTMDASQRYNLAVVGSITERP